MPLRLGDLDRAEAALTESLDLCRAVGRQKAHLTSAMNKLGVDNRAHATVVAIQRGFL